MNDYQTPGPFWTPLFFVTGLSFLLFSAVIEVMQGPHIVLFVRVGCTAIAFGLISYLTSLPEKEPRRNNQLSSGDSGMD